VNTIRNHKALLLLFLLSYVSVGTRENSVSAEDLNGYLREGIEAYNRCDFDKALKAWENGLNLAGNNSQSRGTFYLNIGIAHRNLGEFARALHFYNEALKTYGETDYKGKSACLTNMGVVHMDLKDYPSALSCFHQALEVDKTVDDGQGKGTGLLNIGIVHDKLGHYSKSLFYLQQALLEYRGIKDCEAEGIVLVNIGISYAKIGDPSRALSYLEEALTLSTGRKNPRAIGACLNNIGAVYEDQEKYSEALSNYEHALSLYKDTDLYSEVKRSQANIAEVYLEQGNLKEAWRTFKRLDSPLRMARYYLKTCEYVEAQRELHRNLEDHQGQKTAVFLVAHFIGLGLASEGLQDYERAGEYYRKAVDFIEQQRESLAEAEKRRFFSGKVMGFPRLEPYEGLARVSVYLKDAGEGFYWAENTRARSLLEAMAKRVVGSETGLPPGLAREEESIDNRIAVKYKQIEIAGEKTPGRVKGLEQELEVLKKMQKALILRLRKEHPEYAAMAYPQPLRAEEISLLPGEVLIAYEVTDKATFAWVIRKGDAVKAVSIPLGRKDLTEKVLGYRKGFEGIQRRSDLSRFDPLSGKGLYDLVFSPLSTHLKDGDRLILVPDEILAALPFETLVVDLPQAPKMGSGEFGPFPEGVTYLGDKYPISYAQSATTLTIIRSQQKREGEKENRMLVVADPVFTVQDARLKGNTLLAQADPVQVGKMNAMVRAMGGEFKRLEMTGQLARNLKTAYGREAEVLEGPAATEEGLRKRPLGQYRHHVFATHGILDNQVAYIQEPALVLSQVGVHPQDRNNDGFLTMTEVMGLKLNADVAALTACSTGVGKTLTGEGVMHMGRAFQYAGARSVLMSLWSVAEDSTTCLTERFFVHLKEGKDARTSLRQARKEARKAGYEHPYYWGGFVLMAE